MQNKIELATYMQAEASQLAQGSELVSLLNAIAKACASIHKLTTKGELAGVGQKVDNHNVQGEAQTSLDVSSNGIFVIALKKSGNVLGLVSEELDSPIFFDCDEGKGKFLVAFDPLDGSSNIAVNVTVGTIFSIMAAPTQLSFTDQDFLQKGTKQIAAGYVAYGPSCVFVLTIGTGTHGFTLDTETDTFYLTHPNIQIPEECSEFSINTSNERFWEAPVTRYIDECKAGVSGPRNRNFNMRWVASMVADVHRVLMRGGVYLYPRETKVPKKEGRLRLLYEANPMSMLVEQAGGKCSTGNISILEIEPHHIHQRIPVILGSSSEVKLIERYHVQQ